MTDPRDPELRTKLMRAMRSDSPIGAEILVRMAFFAEAVARRDRYEIALQHQQIKALLAKFTNEDRQ
jgi:hypothetical protein